MATQTYHGSCHCGAVRFETDLDLGAVTGRCNCSICTKTRSWIAVVKPQAFRLLAGEAALSDYQFGGKHIHHVFCSHCGVRPFAYGIVEETGRLFHAVKLNCLDDADPSELAKAPVRYMDGRNDKFERAPADIRHL